MWRSTKKFFSGVPACLCLPEMRPLMNTLPDGITLVSTEPAIVAVQVRE